MSVSKGSRVTLAGIAIFAAACNHLAPAPSVAIQAQPAGRMEEVVRDADAALQSPKRVFGVLLEQGSEDARPDLSAMADYRAARMKSRAEAAEFKIAASEWTRLGPDHNLGRVIDIAFVPQDPNTVYIASPGGGVYKSVDGGANWTWLGALPYQAVNSVAIDAGNPNILYVGTGHYASSNSDLLSAGIYKSTDGGASFTVLPGTVPTLTQTQMQRITRVRTHPTIPNLVLVATFAGTFRSTDGGATWATVSSLSTYDLVIDPNNPSNMVRGRYNGAVSVSRDAGATWTEAPIVPPGTSSIHTRVQYAKSAPGVVYASVNQNEGELHRSSDGGLTWSKVSTPAHNGDQGFHTNLLWVSPSDANHLIVGGVDLYRSVDAGLTFTKISNWQLNSSQASVGLTPTTPHADHNAIASPPNYSEANRTVFFGTDGGLYRTADARVATETTGWTKAAGSLNLTQFVGASGRRVGSADTLIGGTQDNGSIRHVGGLSWSQFAGGDGGITAIDPVEDYRYTQYVYASVQRAFGTANASYICTGITEAYPTRCGSTNVQASNFYAPMAMDPNSPGRLYVGANSLWVTANAKVDPVVWTAIKSPLPTSTGATTNYLSAIAVSKTDSNVVWVGHNDGRIFRTAGALSAAPVWTAVTGGLPTGRLVSALAIDPEDGNRVYVGFAGYFADNLWRSDNGGSTWRNISAGLPPGTMYSVTRHPRMKEKVFVGTIWGSYGSDDGGLSWPVANDGPFATQVRKLFWLGNDTLVAATFGAGMSKATVAAGGPADYSDMWWAGQAENGWGMSIQQHASGVQFNAIFVYDGAGAPRWYVMPGGTWNSNFTSYTGTLYQPTSAPFNSYTPSRFVVGSPAGSMTINFTSASTATMSYTINGVSGSKSIQRQLFGSGTATLAVGDMWWGGTTQDGWGLSLSQQGGVLFGVWYTYGADGRSTWFVLPGGTWSGNTYSGTLYSTTGSAWLGTAYNPAAFQPNPVGTMSINFSSVNAATLSYSFTGGAYAGTSQSKPISRQPY